ncbi:hypothetical protein [Neobacillus muris]|uniref:hypothetical protein n=1 Tax=Neobacillus muris TaxID=2941334 RepID=UPI00203F21C0|nr:hypothetical protein [Neobacillus muris]
MNGMDWIQKRKLTKGKFIEKEKSAKLLLQRLETLCFAASTVVLILSIVHSIFTVFTWGIWIISSLSLIHSWTSTFVIGSAFLGKVLQRFGNK